MQITGRIIDISVNDKRRESKISLVLNTDEISILEQLKNEKKINIELNRYKNKRSLDANNYFWKLLQELCELTEINPIDEYKRRVKQLGIFRIFRIEKENIKTFERMWTAQGIAWFCEIADTEYVGDIEFKIINSYYGSSSFNTKQMSRLINDLVQDCKALGIQTKTKKGIDKILEEWGSK